MSNLFRLVNPLSGDDVSTFPVTITVTPCKGSGDRSLELTSPIPRASISVNQNSPLSSRGPRRSSLSSGNRRSSGGEGRYCFMSVEDLTAETNSECVVSYTVHIPPTPDHQTIFAGGFKSVTRGHVIDCSMDQADPEKKLGQICWLKGCDEKVVHGRCECGFKICRDCYFDCITSGGGSCPGCKEPYRDINDDQDTEEDEVEEEEDEAKPLPQKTDSKLDKRLSVVKSFKAHNQAGDFDHTRWLFETKGTYMGMETRFGLKMGMESGRVVMETGMNSHRSLGREAKDLLLGKSVSLLQLSVLTDYSLHCVWWLLACFWHGGFVIQTERLCGCGECQRSVSFGLPYLGFWTSFPNSVLLKD